MMNSGRLLRFALTAGVVVALVVSACGGGGGQSIAVTPKAGSGAIVVRARATAFSVDRIEVTAGASTTVTLQNEDAGPHTFTVYLAASAGGAKVADTGEVAPGASGEATVLFTSGQHAFRCEFHPETMQGVIVVR